MLLESVLLNTAKTILKTELKKLAAKEGVKYTGSKYFKIARNMNEKKILNLARRGFYKDRLSKDFLKTSLDLRDSEIRALSRSLKQVEGLKQETSIPKLRKRDQFKNLESYNKKRMARDKPGKKTNSKPGGKSDADILIGETVSLLDEIAREIEHYTLSPAFKIEMLKESFLRNPPSDIERLKEIFIRMEYLNNKVLNESLEDGSSGGAVTIIETPEGWKVYDNISVGIWEDNIAYEIKSILK